MKINKLGIVGFGIMGSGIAQVCAQAGYTVTVSEVNQTLLDKGRAYLETSLAKGVEKGKMSAAESEAIKGRVKGTISLRDLSDSDLVVEAAVEDMEVKKKVFAELDKICPSKTIMATNTSCLSVTDIATSTKRPDKVAGLHFFNPVPQMGLIEIVRTLVVSEETLQICIDFSQSIGKTAVVAKDTPGFIVNRLLLPYILNAIRLLENGVATRDDIDNSIKLGLNHPVGPLALADLIGLDVVKYMADSLYDEFKEPQYVSPVLLKKMVVAGQLGRKARKGFYEYQ